MGEGQDEGEKPLLRSRFGVFRLNQLEIIRVPPHLHPLPPGERKEKQKDEILTASEYEASG
jgi:hypothetical protein